MPPSVRQKSKAKPSARRSPPPRKTATKTPSRPLAKKAPSTAPAKTKSAAPKSPAAEAARVTPSIPVVRRADGRVHVLSLSFVRDWDEFLARMESDGGQITELKNRSLDQLLTLVASELEDLLE